MCMCITVLTKPRICFWLLTWEALNESVQTISKIYKKNRSQLFFYSANPLGARVISQVHFLGNVHLTEFSISNKNQHVLYAKFYEIDFSNVLLNEMRLYYNWYQLPSPYPVATRKYVRY